MRRKFSKVDAAFVNLVAALIESATLEVDNLRTITRLIAENNYGQVADMIAADCKRRTPGPFNLATRIRWDIEDQRHEADGEPKRLSELTKVDLG